jgi:hypothetical protein
MTGLHLDDDQLVRYLLGLLPEDDAERIDELSIADEDVVWRLRAVEDDLVDDYVRGALSGEVLEHFESFYLSSPLRREKVRVARSFLHAADAQAAPVSAARPRVPGPALVSRQKPGWWMLAAAAALLLVVGGALLFQNLRLRQELQEAQSARAAMDRRARDLEQQLAAQRATQANTGNTGNTGNAANAANPASAATPSGPSGPPPASPVLTTVALVLLPQTRAAAPLTPTKLPSGADRVSAELRFESNDYSRYQAALKESATGRIIWRSDVLTARTAGDTPAVSFIVPASLFEARHYVFELTGRNAAERAELIGSYPFLIARP